ncbi:hypothetical protein X801_03201 [Opisthorchis viverrini]|uniref:Uncharacterized protein n=1 Tax=Opisthorchis viverrini TaxID=6198 RepID=A0A1S8X2Q6_OPIVI|nr:hypothetical protein X801_03201 [Opisthorchis viverrini]
MRAKYVTNAIKVLQSRSWRAIHRMKAGTSMQRQKSRLQMTVYFLLYVCWQAHPSQSSPIYLDNVEDAIEYGYPEQLANPADELRRLRVVARELLQEMGMRRNTGIKGKLLWTLATSHSTTLPMDM